MAATRLPIVELFPGFDDGGHDLGYSPHGNTGIAYGGNHWLFIRQGGEYTGDALFHILKSTDGGVTWSEIDSWNAGAVPSLAVCRDGTTVYLFYTDTKFNSTSHCTAIKVRTYDLTGDSLSGEIATGPTPEKLWHAGSYIDAGRVGIAAACRGTGEMLLIYPSAPSGGDNRLSLVAFNGSAFGTPIPLTGVSGEYYIATSAMFDGAGIWHSIIEANTATRKLMHLAVDIDASTVGTSDILTTTTPGDLGPPNWVSRLTTFDAGSGEQIAFAFAESYGGGGSIYYAPAGHLSPSWSSVSFSPSPPVNTTSTIAWGMGIAIGVTDVGLNVYWTAFGVSPTYDVGDKLGKIYLSSASYSNLSSWSSPAAVIVDDNFAASTVMAYQGVGGGGVFAGFVQAGSTERGEDSWWIEFTSGTGGGGGTIQYFNEFD